MFSAASAVANSISWPFRPHDGDVARSKRETDRGARNELSPCARYTSLPRDVFAVGGSCFSIFLSPPDARWLCALLARSISLDSILYVYLDAQVKSAEDADSGLL